VAGTSWERVTKSEVLFYTDDVDQARTAIAAVGGRISHVLSEHLVVALLPEGVGLSSVPGASPVDLDGLEGMELRLARAWVSRLGAESVPDERPAKAGPSLTWDAPGRLPPDPPRQVLEELRRRERK
jgi:hypothetical protein